ncbi:hypothetical protein, partial [Mediterraneibacter gnavus]|uniref:hypothetical protein n=1 Tax=Mediterraneibacter gnavus TaxID=33038 RepID=UPI0022E16FA7
VPEVFLPHKSALIGYHIRILLSRTFFTLSSDLLSHPVPLVSYHGKSELSMFFLFFILFAQFRQFNGFFHIKRKKDITSESNVLPLLK